MKGTMKKETKVELVGLKEIELHPDNGRDKKQLKAGLASLVQSLKAAGQLVPGLARRLDDGTIQLICGRRRFEALKEIKATEMALIVQPMTDYEAVEAMVTENLQREGMTLLEELKEVKRLVSLGDVDALTPDAISQRVGRPVTWARRMLSLTALTKEDLEKIEETLDFAPSINLLARFMTVHGEEREQMIDELGNCSNEVEAICNLDSMKVDLSKAAFNAGECATCTSNTATSPGLWDDGEQSLGMCLNKKCFASKTRTVHLETIIKKAQKKPDEQFVVVCRSAIPMSLPKNVKVLDSYGTTIKHNDTYVKAFFVEDLAVAAGSYGFSCDPNADEERNHSSSTAGKKKVSADAPVETQIAAKSETLKGLRLKIVSEEMRAKLIAINDGTADGAYPEKFEDYDFEELLAVGLTLGLRKCFSVENCEQVLLTDVESARRMVWAGIKSKVLEVIQCRDGSSALYREETLKNICTLTGLDFDALYARASEEKPEPKSLVKLRAEAGVAK